MNYNQFSSTGLELINDEINSRARLDTGTQCNYECSFCYYIDKLGDVTSFEVIKKRTRKIFDFGMREIDLSGGESSIHKSWFEILDYCTELGFENVSCLSNGSKFSSYDFCKKSKEHGLSEVLFSLHGWDDLSHQSIVGRKGAFNKILEAIGHCQNLGIKVRLNCTVTGLSAKHLKSYAALVNKITPSQINFLPLNYWEEAAKVQSESYEELSVAIKGAIDLIDKGIEINVRYIPFCFMEGYEKYVVGIYQHIFDQADWNIICYEIDDLVVRSVSLKDYFDIAKKKRLLAYTKPKKCFDCKYFNICDGIEHKLSAEQKVYPCEGDRILDVQYYRKS